MVRELKRPPEDSEVRQMRLEGLESAMEYLRNAQKEAHHEGDLPRARTYARQQDRVAAEILARRQERDGPDTPAQETEL